MGKANGGNEIAFEVLDLVCLMALECGCSISFKRSFAVAVATAAVLFGLSGLSTGGRGSIYCTGRCGASSTICGCTICIPARASMWSIGWGIRMSRRRSTS